LIVDDVTDTLSHVSRLLSFEPDIEVVGEATSAVEAIRLTRELRPDIVLMDINMPDVDGLEATERLFREVPGVATIMMSVNDDSDYVRRAMMAGARGYLVKPFNSDELVASIRGVFVRRPELTESLVAVGPGTNPHERNKKGRIVAVFSPKGGVGRTTLAVNLAVAAASLEKSVALVDADLQFGDAAVLLNLDAKKGSFADVATELSQGNPDGVEAALLTHRSNVHVLLSPPSPDAAETITEEHMRTVLDRLTQGHDLVVVDCATHLDDTTLAILDVADQILMPVTLDMTAILSTRVFLEVGERIGYRDGKVTVVLNRADSNHGIQVEDVERSIGRKVDHMVVSDGRAAVHALNLGVPFVLGNKRARVSEDIMALARSYFAEAAPEPEAPAPRPRLERRLAFARR
jgi:pilus assembly protein CpaE